MMSTIPSGMPGNSGICPEPVRADDRVGHLEAVDPPRRRVQERGLDDRRPDDRERQLLLGGELLHRALAHRLRERVDVRPSEGPSALPPVLDEPLRSSTPCGAARRRPRRSWGRRASAPSRASSRKRSRSSGFRDAASTSRRAHIARSASSRQSTRWSSVRSGITPFCTPGHVRGRDVDERGSRSSGEHAAVEVHRAEQVRLEALVDGRVERDRRRRSGSRRRWRRAGRAPRGRSPRRPPPPARRAGGGARRPSPGTRGALSNEGFRVR